MKTLATICALLLVSAVMFGQTSGQPMGSGQTGGQGQGQMGGHMGHGGGPHMNPDQMLQHLTQQLNLTSDQQAKIKPILQDQQKQMEKTRSDSQLSQQDRRQKMQQMRESTHSKIRDVLNPDQQKKWDEMRQQGPMGPRHGHGSMMGGPPSET